MTAESRAGNTEVCGATVAEIDVVDDELKVIRYRVCQRTEGGEGCVILIIQDSGLWAKRTKDKCKANVAAKLPPCGPGGMGVG